MKTEIRWVFVDPCLGFKRAGMQVSLFKVKRDGEKLQLICPIHCFYDNHFNAEGLKVGDILCHKLSFEHFAYASRNDEHHFLVVVGISEKEIEFSSVFEKVEDLFAYLDKKK